MTSNLQRASVGDRADVFEPWRTPLAHGHRPEISVDATGPSCTVCGLTIISGEVVVFDHDELIHIDCHGDHTTSRRPLSRAMRWPR